MSFWHSTLHFLFSFDWPFYAVWALTITLLVSGLIGSCVPMVPGPLIIFAACVEHSLLRPQSRMGWWGLGAELLLVIAACVLDFMSGAAGSKWFGGSRWGTAGVLIGGLVGLFFGFVGLIIGPIIGGFLFEMLFARKTMKPAAKATWGTVVGTGLGMIARIGVGVVMIILFFVDALWR